MKTQDELAAIAYEMWRAEAAPDELPPFDKAHLITQNWWISRVAHYQEKEWYASLRESVPDQLVRFVCSEDSK